MKLYTNPFSTNARRVTLVIAHLGLDVEQEVVDFGAGAHKSPEFLAINPNGQLPAFTDGGLFLFESNAIATYLCDLARAQGNPGAEQLWPTDPRARADVMRWICWQLAKWDNSCGPIGYEGMVKPLFFKTPGDEEKLARATALFHKQAAILERALEGRDWLVGERLTLADYGLNVSVMGWPQAPYPIDDYPNIKAWVGRVREQPAWAATQPRFLGA